MEISALLALLHVCCRIILTMTLVEGRIKATNEACYDGNLVQDFQFYIKQSREHDAILHCVKDVLHRDFNRYCKTQTQTSFNLKIKVDSN